MKGVKGQAQHSETQHRVQNVSNCVRRPEFTEPLDWLGIKYRPMHWQEDTRFAELGADLEQTHLPPEVMQGSVAETHGQLR